MRNSAHILCILMLMVIGGLQAEGFFEVLYSAAAEQLEDRDGLDDASSIGIFFGYDTAIASTGLFLDIELGYEMSKHEIGSADDHEYYYNCHRGFVGVRVKWGGWQYVDLYVGTGIIPDAYYEASDTASDDGFLDLRIDKGFSGSYLVYGIDVFVPPIVYLGIEQRTLAFDFKDDDDTMEGKAKIERLGFKLGVLF
ncbi:outer membrane beta-barrel protein [Planctomycetota bacterium]